MERQQINIHMTSGRELQPNLLKVSGEIYNSSGLSMKSMCVFKFWPGCYLWDIPIYPVHILTLGIFHRGPGLLLSCNL